MASIWILGNWAVLHDWTEKWNGSILSLFFCHIGAMHEWASYFFETIQIIPAVLLICLKVCCGKNPTSCNGWQNSKGANRNFVRSPGFKTVQTDFVGTVLSRMKIRREEDGRRGVLSFKSFKREWLLDCSETKRTFVPRLLMFIAPDWSARSIHLAAKWLLLTFPLDKKERDE